MDNQKSFPKGIEKHPLAQCIIKVEEEINNEVSPSRDLLRLAWTSYSIYRLRNERVEGVDERVLRLKSDDFNIFWATMQELRTACHYLEKGRKVLFISESDKKTPDLLLDDSIEIECKHKSRSSKKDRRRHALYRLLRQKIIKHIYLTSSLDGIEVEALFYTEPSLEGINSLIEKIKVFWDSGSSHVAIIQSSDVMVRLVRIPSGPWDYDETAMFLREIARVGLVVDLQSRIRKLESGKYEESKIAFFLLECSVPEDYVKGLKRSLDDAAGQFSGKRAGIVFLDITPTAPYLRQYQVGQVRAMINGVFRNRSSVSAIVIAEEVFVREGENWKMGISMFTMNNPNAKYPIVSSNQ